MSAGGNATSMNHMDSGGGHMSDPMFTAEMIPHHQAAIEMARIVLKHGKDEQAKKLAHDVIREQTREIADMEEWLKKRAR